MAWVLIDDEAPSHPKIVPIGAAGLGLFTAGLCYANHRLTEGFIPVGSLSAVLPGERWSRLVIFASKLVEVGLWEKREDGWQIHDYLHWQKPKGQVLTERALKQASKVAGGLARAATAARSGGRFHQQNDQQEHQQPHQQHQQPTSSRPAEAPADHQQATSPTPTPTPKEEEATTLSRSRATSRNGHGFSEESKAVLRWLNEKAGKHFQPVAAHLRFIEARLKDHEPWVLRKVVSMKSQKWHDDPKTREWLRPKTLFNETNFANYVGELPAAGADDVSTG
jgi:uncharacterized phage protein (TIGR02220 family)